MHHRRGRTTRREVKRLDDKSYRQAEKRAIARGSADNPPQDSWGYRPEPLPLGDVPCNGKVHGKHKKAKKRQQCKVAGKHDWVHETNDERGYELTRVGSWWNCGLCDAMRAAYEGPYPWMDRADTVCHEHLLKRWYTQKIKTSLCVECALVKIKKGDRVFDDGRSRWWNGRKLYLPKRPVKF